jgi:predicted DNA-binding protein
VVQIHGEVKEAIEGTLKKANALTYLADVLEKIVSGQTKVNSLPDLLP